MNKKAIYNFLKKLNTTKTYKGLADFVIENLTKLTKAQACWIGLINYTTMIVEVKKIYKTEGFNKNKQLIGEVKKIRQTVFDFYNNFEIEDIVEHIATLSKENKIILPIIYRKNVLGYVGLISDDVNFNKKNIEAVSILVQNIASKLEIISLYEERAINKRERLEFLASISHEFKTPLNSIIGFSDILAIKCENKDNLKYIDNISKSSRFLMDLIQITLDFARNGAKPIELICQEFRSKEVISDMIWGFEEIRKEKNININYTLSDVIINADITRFQQLIYNLISNAIKFSKDNSEIVIVTYVNNKHEFVFEIKDSGDGISKKDIGKIFNFFTQVNRNQLKRQQGSGVGLAVCKKIARAHGGDIIVKSRLHYGSTFWVVLPQNK